MTIDQHIVVEMKPNTMLPAKKQKTQLNVNPILIQFDAVWCHVRDT